MENAIVIDSDTDDDDDDDDNINNSDGNLVENNSNNDNNDNGAALRPHYKVEVRDQKIGVTFRDTMGRFGFVEVTKVSNPALDRIKVADVLIEISGTTVVGLKFDEIVRMLIGRPRPMSIGFLEGRRLGLGPSGGEGELYLKQKYMEAKKMVEMPIRNSTSIFLKSSSIGARPILLSIPGNCCNMFLRITCMFILDTMLKEIG